MNNIQGAVGSVGEHTRAMGCLTLHLLFTRKDVTLWTCDALLKEEFLTPYDQIPVLSVDLVCQE